MNKDIITFNDNEIEKHKFHCSKDSVDVKHVVIDKVAISNQVSFSKKYFKYFIGFKNDEKVKLLCKESICKSSHETKRMSLFVKK